MITADPNSFLGHWCRIVDGMKPGQLLKVHMMEIEKIASYEHNGATFTPADRILGNIVGAGYTHSYSIEPDGRHIVFHRHAEDGRKTYEDPDRRIRAQRA